MNRQRPALELSETLGAELSLTDGRVTSAAHRPCILTERRAGLVSSLILVLVDGPIRPDRQVHRPSVRDALVVSFSVRDGLSVDVADLLGAKGLGTALLAAGFGLFDGRFGSRG